MPNSYIYTYPSNFDITATNTANTELPQIADGSQNTYYDATAATPVITFTFPESRTINSIYLSATNIATYQLQVGTTNIFNNRNISGESYDLYTGSNASSTTATLRVQTKVNSSQPVRFTEVRLMQHLMTFAPGSFRDIQVSRPGRTSRLQQAFDGTTTRTKERGGRKKYDIRLTTGLGILWDNVGTGDRDRQRLLKQIEDEHDLITWVHEYGYYPEMTFTAVFDSGGLSSEYPTNNQSNGQSFTMRVIES